MRAPSLRVILLLVRVTSQRITAEPISMAISMISKLSGVMVPKMTTGSPSTIQILKMLLPTMLPTSNSCSLRLAAVTVVINSGSEVPKATTESAIIRSDMPMAAAIVEAELTTSWLPPTTPIRPINTKRNDLPNLY